MKKSYIAPTADALCLASTPLFSITSGGKQDNGTADSKRFWRRSFPWEDDSDEPDDDDSLL